MRGAAAVALLVLLATWRSEAGADTVPAGADRPVPAVHLDPPAFYSPALYTAMGKPRRGEWMAEHPEPPQSFEEYAASSPVRPTRDRRTIVLSPLGPMPDKDRRRLAVLREYLELYYTVPVRLGSDLGLENVVTRDRPAYGRGAVYRQYLTTEILDRVLRPALPKDALCLQAVTMEDLYPDPSWNYVFGQASLAQRVGVYSLVRFYPTFWNQPETAETEHLGLVRSLATLVHETGHMLGVTHCQKYLCVMNGSNSLAESDGRPIHLCPECLKKFRWNLGFEVVPRYEALRRFYEARGLKAEADWVARRLAECRGAARP